MPDKTEFEKMLSGEHFNAAASEFAPIQGEAARKMQAYNSMPADDIGALVGAMRDICHPDSVFAIVKPPFFFEFGRHIHFGEQVFVNMNCTFLDSAPIRIGDFTAIGPNCQLITPTHELEFEKRLPLSKTGPQRRDPVTFAKPIHIGKHCWLGAGVIVMPGITIGDGAVIGAGSVVTKDIPANVIAIGSPCRVVQKIPESD
ncbi:MAG: sugar O-acetyltransferase [Hyphomicrobiaceae bacterium]|nr:sugar O-acetyltransferase [Hyphomicrobiaceae bacterium]MCC0023696.1 sugar O-acetyltransferase [Hyphomicrobiaceae bacterium]